MKTEALEGYRELGAPAMFGPARSHEPDAIPRGIDLAVFDDEGVNERTQRVGRKVEGVAPIAEGINEKLYAIVRKKVGVTRHLCADNLLRV